MTATITCKLLGHRFRFRAEGATMYWTCERGCGAGGEKVYSSPELAQRYASTFDGRRGTDHPGPMPILGLFPLTIWRWVQRKRKAGPAHRTGEGSA